MHWTRTYALPVVVATLVVAVTAVYYRHTWLGWFTASGPKAPGEDQAAPPADQVVLSPQARENLQPDAKRLYTQTYERLVQLPGEIVDRPGFSDRGVVAPVSGTVLDIHAHPGDVVKPGQALFKLRVVSETVSTTRSELFKARRDYEITRQRKDRLADLATGGESVAASKVFDLDNQLSRLDAAMGAYRQELQQRGLSIKQIDAAEKGRFEDEIEIFAPPQVAPASHPDVAATRPVSLVAAENHPPVFEVQDLKVELGQQVQVGQTLCLLSDHRWLYIEGRGFRQEIPLVARAAKVGWKVQVEFLEESSDGWDEPLETTLEIRHLANTLDPATRTFAFYLTLRNQSKSYEKDGRKLLMCRFRPGQRVRLNVPVKEFEEQLEDGKPVLKEKRVYVLPSDAVARDGPEAYVFEEKGQAFKRHSVRVLHEDRHEVVIDPESLKFGLKIARHGALQLNRVLKAEGSKVPAGYHIHADGSVHMNTPGDEG